MKKTKPIIAIDGLAASGKGTIAQRIAAHFNFFYLDTGLLYRSFAYLLETNQFADSADIVTSNFDILSITNRPLLRTERIAEAASIISQDQLVRDYLLDIQRNIAYSPPENKKGAVLDGRDIGTVVCPDADFKIFVTASLEERAMRRILELDQGYAIDEVIDMLKDRDTRDKNRTTAPLKNDPSYFTLDTTNLTIGESFRMIVEKIKPVLTESYYTL